MISNSFVYYLGQPCKHECLRSRAARSGARRRRRGGGGGIAGVGDRSSTTHSATPGCARLWPSSDWMLVKAASEDFVDLRLDGRGTHGCVCVRARVSCERARAVRACTTAAGAREAKEERIAVSFTRLPRLVSLHASSSPSPAPSVSSSSYHHDPSMRYIYLLHVPYAHTLFSHRATLTSARHA